MPANDKLRTTVYVDAFNLYYGAIKGTPYKWLDLHKMCSYLLPRNDIQAIKYFTARVTSRDNDPRQEIRQDLYVRALRTLPNVTVVYGHFLQHRVFLPSAEPPHERVRVIRTEEKGSDVNLATYLLYDAFINDYDVAVIISNDSDLLLPVRTVRRKMGKTIGILNPHRKHPSKVLQKEANFIKTIREGVVRISQFPETLSDSHGSFRKPPEWK